MKVGDVLYKYNFNRRIYRDPATNECHRSPIYKYSFNTFYCVGETVQSYILAPFKDYDPKSNRCIKLKKKSIPREYGYLTESEMEDDIWLHDNKHRVSEMVRLCKDIIKIKAIKKILEDS